MTHMKFWKVLKRFEIIWKNWKFEKIWKFEKMEFFFLKMFHYKKHNDTLEDDENWDKLLEPSRQARG